MHAYEVSRRQPFPSVPSARPAHAYVPSATPIYDALYAEYVKSFRTLPGDRSGEERLAFGGPWRYGHGSGGGFTGGYSAGAHAARHSAEQSAPSPWQRVGRLATGGARPEPEPHRGEEAARGSADPTGSAAVSWQSGPHGGRAGRHTAPQAALPPAPRAAE
ncbi:hypothetical protein [Streptomyces sp. MJP52]|uniref:hypothetical protein n=1 Tax=Streptomyces sp. MJP52 TaxID=2940555 RepID=UPI0024763836|nr:hypothetical protein [Streptomyces sp. MJP52]MDH6227661.1 hypothetical protein [Streptomyces sp. MJP52]